MTPRQFLICCIVTSLFIHLWLVQLDWSPEPAVGGELISVPLKFDIHPATSSSSTVLEQGTTENPDESNTEEHARRLERLAKTHYLKQVREAVEQRKFLSGGDELSGLIGNAQYIFHIRPNDTFSGIKLVRTSGNTCMDKAAGKAIAAASGVVNRPRILRGQSYTIMITVKYQRNM